MNIDCLFELDQCIDWIGKNNLRNVALQFCKWQIKYSANVVKYLKEKTNSNNDYFIIISSACSVDYLSPMHLGENVVDGIIHFGDSCFAPIVNTIKEIPVLFIFGDYLDKDHFDFVKKYISNIESDNNLIIYDNKYLRLVKQLVNDKTIKLSNCAKLISFSKQWSFSETSSELITTIDDVKNKLGQFCLTNPLTDYDRVIFIGAKVSLFYRVECINGLLLLNPEENISKEIKHLNETSKRIALIEKLKSPNCHIGAIFTYSYSSVDDYYLRIKQLSMKLNHKLSVLSLVQSTDECKLGNFSDLNALVFINQCYCYNLIDNIKLHIPMITFDEYELVAGVRKSYGGHEWHLEDTNDDVLELNNYQIIEADVLSAHTWYGMSFSNETSDVSIVKEGQKGIASMYREEPK